MVTVPAFFPVTVPPMTVAILVLLLDHVTTLFVALVGSTSAVNRYVPPTLIVADFALNLIPVAGTPVELFAVTLTVAVAVLPLKDLAVIVTVPAFLPVTTPLLTVAISLLLLVQVIFLSVALLGEIFAVRVTVEPALTDVEVGEMLNPVTGIVVDAPEITVIFAVAVLPLCVLAVMTAVPNFLPVTTPPFTVAILASLVDQVTEELEALFGITVAFNLIVAPIFTLSLDLSSLIPVGLILP